MAFLVGLTGCATTRPEPETGWRPCDPTDDWVLGDWQSITDMSEREAGVCHLSITADRLRLTCSPGGLRVDTGYVLTTDGGTSTLRVPAAPAYVTRTATVRRECRSGQVSIVVVDPDHPGATFLGAYGNADRWLRVERVTPPAR